VEALRLAESEVKAGAAGVVFGRNAIQVPDPHKFQAALCDVVRNKEEAEDVARRYQLD
jgi:DhnA family fructose-bisphosphate aldolase class Ia